MAGLRRATGIVRFGDVEADLDAGEIVREGRRVSLPDQPLRILTHLIQHPGTVLRRDDLRRELWSDDTFVDFEHGLNSAMKRLRDALGDSADAPRYIETVPRRGYRFIGTLEGEDALRGPESSSSKVGTRHFRLWTGVVIVVLAGTAVVWRTFIRPPTASDPAATPVVASRVLVAVLEPASQGQSLSVIGKLAADQLIAVIGRLDSADVLTTPLPSASSEHTTSAARRSGAGLAIDVVYHPLGSEQVFEARIHDAMTREALYFSPRFTGNAKQPSAAIEQLAQAVGGAIAVHLDHVFGGLPMTSQPPVLDAYLEYRAGRELLEKDYPRAIAQLQRAANTSPGYLLPRLTLVMAYDNLGDRERRSAQMAQIADHAHQLSAGERLLVEYMTESLARRPASALRALVEAEKLAPGSWIVNYGIQQEALFLHRPKLTIEAFDRLPLHDRDRRYNGWRLGLLARALHLVGDYRREVVESRRAQEYEPGNVYYVADEVRSLAGLGEVERVREVIDDSLAAPAAVADSTIVIERAARELRAHGYKARALETASRGAEWLRARRPRDATRQADRAALARLLYLAERWPEAEALFQQLSAERPDELEYTGYLGVIAARRQDHKRAGAIAERLHRWPDHEVFGRHTYWRAAITSWLGDRERAVMLLREAFAQGHNRGLRIHEGPEFEMLRDDPAFAALVRPRD